MIQEPPNSSDIAVLLIFGNCINFPGRVRCNMLRYAKSFSGAHNVFIHRLPGSVPSWVRAMFKNVYIPRDGKQLITKLFRNSNSTPLKCLMLSHSNSILPKLARAQTEHVSDPETSNQGSDDSKPVFFCQCGQYVPKDFI